MIGICLYGGIQYDVNFDYDVMVEILKDPLIPPDSYLPFVMDDGLRARLRKRDIVAVYEIYEETV